MVVTHNVIGGQFVEPASQEYLDNVNPATAERYGLVAASNSNDVQAAYRAASAAFPRWAAMPHDERSRILSRVADLIESRLEQFALAESTDTGKPLSAARSIDIPRAAKNFRFFAHALTQFSSEAHSMNAMNEGAGALNYTLRQPLGVVGCISPWNLPLYLFTWKIAPALAMGNCVVAKPSELTPVTATMLAELCHEAGLPPGVLNVVHGLGTSAGQAIVEHPDIKAISFTGGTATGRVIARTAAPFFKKLSLELGGKNPTIVFADADYPRALNTALQAAFNNQGQICLCGSRIYVERALYERFREDFVRRASALVVGDPLTSSTQQGSLVSEQHLQKMLTAVSIAREEGGTILCGGERVIVRGRCEQGWFFAPTVIEGLPAQCHTNQEEIFGPIVTLQSFDTEEEALTLANSTPYGLAASVWTEHLSRAHRVAAQLQSGIVWINCWMLRDLRTPFGGVKQSGVGREGGLEALRFFTEPKNVCLKL
jgi:aminomuconate-semialdehyde/2-hydroxymuconate-6-semialdehyde dehydrogenase